MNIYIYIYIEYPMKMYDLGILGVSPFFGNLHFAWNMVHWTVISQPNIWWFHQRNAFFSPTRTEIETQNVEFCQSTTSMGFSSRIRNTCWYYVNDARPTEMGMIPDHGENIPNCQGVQPAWLPCHGDWYTYNIYIYTQYYICIYDSYVLQNPSDSESLRHPLRLGDPKCLVCFG